MSGTEALTCIRALGFKVILKGGKPLVVPHPEGKEPPPDLVATLRANRDEVVAALAQYPGGLAADTANNGTNAAAFAPKITLLSDVQPESVRWVWPGRIPIGKVTVLDGDPGLGKSTVTLDIAARVSTGRSMPDGEMSDLDGPAGVVLLSAEDGLADTIRPRLDAVYAETTRIAAIECMTKGEEERSLSLGDLDAIEQAIRRVDAALVIVDPLMSYLDSETNSYRDQDMRRILAPLARMAERLGVAIIVVRHLSKGVAGNPLYRGGGSIGIIGAARVGLMIGKDPDDASDERRVLAVSKNNLAPPALALAFRIEGTENGFSRVAWDGSSTHTAASLLALPQDQPERNARSEAEDFLKSALADGPVAATVVKEQAKAAGIADATLRRAKDALGVKAQKRGFDADSAWVWALPEGATSQREESKMLMDDRRCSPTVHEHLRPSVSIFDGNETEVSAGDDGQVTHLPADRTLQNDTDDTDDAAHAPDGGGDGGDDAINDGWNVLVNWAHDSTFQPFTEAERGAAAIVGFQVHDGEDWKMVAPRILKEQGDWRAAQ